MISPHGSSLSYSVLMKPTFPTPTVIELFPGNVFSNDNEFVARAMGMEYIGYQDTKYVSVSLFSACSSYSFVCIILFRKITSPSLPPVTDIPDDDMQVIKIDVPGIVRTIKEQMRRR